MNVDVLTGIVLLCAVAMLRGGERVTMKIFIVAILFQSAAAVKFGLFGITPGHFLLAIPAYRCLRDPARREAVVSMLRFPCSGFWLALLCAYCVVTAFFSPRLLAGLTLVNPIGTTAYEPSSSGVPLGPSSGNVTQTLYMVGSALAYLVTAEYGTTTEGLRTIRSGLYAYCLLDIGFAVVDLAGFGGLLTVFHNGNFVLHTDDVASGMKRIAGAFTEAAAFATATMGVLGLTLRLCLGNVDLQINVALTLTVIVLLFLSTSSTAFVSVAVLMASFYTWTCGRGVIGRVNPATIAMIVFVPLTVAVVALAVALIQPLHDTIVGVLNDIIFNKATSSSAVERGSWNRQAVINFFDTFGVGAGTGSARTSSFPLAVLANLGLPGATLYLLFLGKVILSPSGHRGNSVDWHIQGACRWGAFGILIAQTMSGTLVDLGILFFALAGAGSAPARADLLSRSAPGANTQRSRDGEIGRLELSGSR